MNLNDRQKEIIYTMINKKLNEELMAMRAKEEKNKKILIGIVIIIVILVTSYLIYMGITI